MSLSLGVAVVTISDTRTSATDGSGDLLAARAAAAGHRIVARTLVTDDAATIAGTLERLAAHPDVSAVLATGGTGLTGRDVTPEALESIATRMIPGFGELFRARSLASVGVAAIQSRTCAAVVGSAYVFALPGTPAACADAWEIIGPLLDSDHEPGNLVRLLPRLMER